MNTEDHQYVVIATAKFVGTKKVLSEPMPKFEAQVISKSMAMSGLYKASFRDFRVARHPYKTKEK